MDKRKVIGAYQRGFLTLKECAQILGLESNHVETLLVMEQGTAEVAGAQSVTLGREAISRNLGTYEAN